MFDKALHTRKEEAMMRRKFSIAATALVIASLGLTACTSADGGGKPSESSTLTIGWDAGPASWDPVLTPFVPSPYLEAVYENLIERTPEGELVPGLATAWEYDQEFKTLTLTLKEGVEFSDGTAFDAEAAKINLERFRDGNGPRTATFAGVSAVEVVDPATVRIQLASPDPSFLISLASAGGQMASPKAIAENTLTTAPAGTGPYTLNTEDTRDGSVYVFDEVDSPVMDLSFGQVHVRVLSDSSAQLNALKSGEVSATPFSSPQSATEARNSGFEEIKTDGQWLGLAIFDRDGAQVPALADPKVRQALNLAIDRGSMNKAFFDGEGTVTEQIFGPATVGNDPELNGTYDFDPERAKELLEEAGYADGFTVRMPYVNWFGDEFASAIKGAFGDIGVTVDYVQGDPSPDATISDIQGGKYPMSLGGFSFLTDDWTALNEQVLPGAAWNPLESKDPYITERAAAFPLANDEEQKQLASEINTYLVEQAWFVPIVSDSPTTFYDDSVKVVDGTQPLPVWTLFMFLPSGK